MVAEGGDGPRGGPPPPRFPVFDFFFFFFFFFAFFFSFSFSFFAFFFEQQRRPLPENSGGEPDARGGDLVVTGFFRLGGFFGGKGPQRRALAPVEADAAAAAAVFSAAPASALPVAPLRRRARIPSYLAPRAAHETSSSFAACVVRGEQKRAAAALGEARGVGGEHGLEREQGREQQRALRDFLSADGPPICQRLLPVFSSLSDDFFETEGSERRGQFSHRAAIES